MAGWTYTYADGDGVEHAESLQADDIDSARRIAYGDENNPGLLPAGCTFVSLIRDPDPPSEDAVSAREALKKLGLTDAQIDAIVTPPPST